MVILDGSVNGITEGNHLFCWKSKNDAFCRLHLTEKLCQSALWLGVRGGKRPSGIATEKQGPPLGNLI